MIFEHDTESARTFARNAESERSEIWREDLEHTRQIVLANIGHDSDAEQLGEEAAYLFRITRELERRQIEESE